MRKRSIEKKSGIESLGIRIADPGKTVTLAGKEYGDFVLLQHLRMENLQSCAAILEVLSRSGADESELLAKIATNLHLMASETANTVQEFLRVAREQGLRFEIVPAPGDLH